ncbi:MAG: MarR family winged helix-turn-helix transcriptional regulator [Burkholderiales bacterium]|jgi:DNA-binding MarR family transcriptional regulator|nr:MarR family winged helix-turn-helix transcriptional regulator [Burkholderiales bacterium]
MAKPAPAAAAQPAVALADRLTFLVHVASARVATIGNRHFREHDLNHFSARILVLLLEKKELRTGELGELMVLPQSTISSQLQGLHKKRLIRRRRSRQDNRTVMVTLTPAGLELARDCNELSLLVHEAMLLDIPAREQAVAFGFLRKINDRLLVLESQDLYPFHGPEQLQQLASAEQPVRARKRLSS